jgi:GNAT superfamily N-acetyltransferase
MSFFAAERPPYRITTDPAQLDIDTIWGWLRGSYWAAGVSRAIVERAVRNSLSFGIFDATSQVGFARVVTDRATFAYLADVFVDDKLRGLGLGTWLMQSIQSHPQLQGLRRWMLGTRDAHRLYAKVGFRPLAHPEIFMEVHDPDVYKSGS